MSRKYYHISNSNYFYYFLSRTLDKENSLGQEHPARIRKKNGEVFLFLFNLFNFFTQYFYSNW